MSLSVPQFYTDLDPGLPFDAFLLGRTGVQAQDLPYNVVLGETKTYIEIGVLSQDSDLIFPPDTDPKLFNGLQYTIARYGNPADDFVLNIKPMFSNNSIFPLFTREVAIIQWDSSSLRWVPIIKGYLNDTAVKKAVERAASGTLILGAVNLTANVDQTIDLASISRSYRTGTSGWTASRTVALTGVPPLKVSFWVFNESGFTLNLAGNISLGTNPYQLPTGVAILLTENSGVMVKLAETSIGGSVPDNSITTAKIVNDAVTADKLADTAVAPGSYTAANITVDQQGRLTAAASGTAPAIGDGTITNAKLANMAQATFKMRAAGAGTGVPIDGTNVQAKTALAIAQADIIDDVPLSKIADVDNARVLANTSGAVGPVAPTDAFTFKAAFGFGTLANQSNITVSDIQASGAPNISTFLRGDGAWANLVPSVLYDVVDVDNGAVLLAGHSRYQVVGGNVVITQLRLRHITDQTLPVRVIVADDSSVTPEGAEFTFIQAHNQTGLCVIRSEVNGSINGKTFLANAVGGSAWSGASGVNVDISSLPAGANVVGDVFEVRNHSTANNNGFYRNLSGGTLCAKLSGSNPANAASEAVDIDTGFIALAGARASAVLIVDANTTDAPICRLEGETNETRSILGDMTYVNTVNFDGVADFDGLVDFSNAVTFSGGSLNLGDFPLNRALLGDTAETFFDAGNKSAAVSLDYTQGSWQKITATAAITSVTVINWPAAGRVGTLTLEIHKAAGTETIAWGGPARFPGGVDITLGTGTAPDLVVMSTRDGGSFVFVFEGGKVWSA